MTQLAPFRAVRFGPPAGNPGTLLAPPYDVIDSEQAEGLRAMSPYNAIRLVLPEGEGRGRYTRAASRFSEWLDDGILVADDEPALYLHRHTFHADGRPLQRLALFGALKLSAFSEGQVLPHEETHAGPKEDRLALTLSCRAQLSAVFLVASDTDGALQRLMERAAEIGEEVLATETPDGQGHNLYRIAAGSFASELCERVGRLPLLIADGHHRYETALEARRRLSGVPGAQRVLACVVSEADPGLLVLPTHRALRTAPPAGDWPGSLRSAFHLEPLRTAEPQKATSQEALGSSRAIATAAAGEAPGEEMVLLDPARAACWSLRPRVELLARSGMGAVESRVASVLFDRLVLREILRTSAGEAVRRDVLSYHREPGEAAAAAAPDGAAFLLAPVQLDLIRKLARHGHRVPAKTTYFTPKVPSGLLFRRL